MLVAEAAANPAVLIRRRAHWPEPGSGDAARADHAPRQLDARVANVCARARDQLADLILRYSAEGTGQSGVRRGVAILAFQTASPLGKLVQLVAAEPQCGSNVPRPRAVRDQ